MLLIMQKTATGHRLKQGYRTTLTTEISSFVKLLSMKKYFLPWLLLAATIIQAQPWTKQYDFVDDCVCGLAKVSKDGKFGYVDQQGKLIVPVIYQEAMAFSEGFAAVKSESKWGYLDSSGKMVIYPEYEEAGSFHESLAATRKNGKFGFIDKNNKVVIPFNYSMANGFSEGLAPVANDKDMWGYVNASGKLVIPCVFTFADKFEDGRARVIKGSEMSYIDRYGKAVKD